MLKTIQYHEISRLDKYIVRVRGMFRSDGTITQSEAMMLAFFDEIRDKIDAQLSILKSGNEFIDWCKTPEIHAVKEEARAWLAMAKNQDQPEELVNCYSQILFLLDRSVGFYSND